MKIVSIALLFTLTLFASSSLSIGEKVKEKAKEEFDAPRYTIQLFTQYDQARAKEMLRDVPEHLQADTHLYKIGESIKGRYAAHESYSTLRPYLEELKGAGFKDAFIVKSSSLLLQESKIELEETNTTQQEQKEQLVQPQAQNLPVPKPQEPKEKLSKTAKTELLLKAQSAYDRGDESEAMIYYEMLLASNQASQKVKNNLCYLYGKKGAWMQAKRVIEQGTHDNKLLYAYAYGAAQSNQESYYEDLLPYISFDTSGRLLLLTGYYFEKRAQNQEALPFYKMAYEKNSADHYNKFAYARALDIEQNRACLPLYKELLKELSTTHALYAHTQKRVQELGE